MQNEAGVWYGAAVPSMMAVEIKELLSAGVHFGHLVKRWNPKMKQIGRAHV